MFKKLPLFIAFFFIFISYSAQKPKEYVLKDSIKTDTTKLFLKNEPEVDLDSVNLDSVSLNLVSAIITSIKNKETIRTQNENFKKIQTDINKEIIKTIAAIEKSLKIQKLENYSDSILVNSVIDTTSKQIVIGSKDYLNILEVKLSKDTLLTNSEKRKIKRLIRKQHKLNQQLEDLQNLEDSQ